jgi:tetratricopeptide (TPR) repeat protein
MSLLLEALKKAELAKQNAMAEQTPVQPPDPETDGQARQDHVFTRAHLPDLNEPMDIRAEDLAAPRREPVMAEPPPSLVPAPPAPEALRAEVPVQPASRGRTEADARPARDAARQLFDVKEVDYNPRRPFHITLGALIAAAMGYGGYVWWQMQPRYPSAAAAAAIQAAATAVNPGAAANVATEINTAARASAVGAISPASAPDAPMLALPVARTSAPSQPPAAPVPATPTSVPAAPAPAPVQPAATAKAAPGSASRPATRSVTSAARLAPAAPSPSPDQGPITVTPPSLQANEALERAYAAYQRDDVDEARQEYQAILAREPNSRDALLGLAAIDMRLRNFDTAEMRYLRLLELDPRDSYASAGLIALHGATNPIQSESRIKTLIAGQPDATHLYFSLGNQYAAQGRWTEAQNAYFKAYSAHPDNPDFAYNLAVSLDHLGRPWLALEYYRKALGLASQRMAAFDRARAEGRARELAR